MLRTLLVTTDDDESVSSDAARADATLAAAVRIAAILESMGVESAVIGAIALAVHGYARATEDVDLGIAVADPFLLGKLGKRVEVELGLVAQYSSPDHLDALGGVLTVTGDGIDAVQVVNFVNVLSGISNPGSDAIREAVLVEDLGLRVITLPHLIALKLYAGSFKSMVDVHALLDCNPDFSLEKIGVVCASHGLTSEWLKLRETKP